MATTTNLSLTLVEQAQAQKEVTVNAALTRIDALLNRGVEDKDLATPPGSPSAGDMYIVGGSATGDWSMHDGELAYYEQIWRFVSPNEGMRVFVKDETTAYVYDGTNWLMEVSQLNTVRTTGSSGGSLTVDYGNGPVQDITLDNATVTLAFSNPPASGKAGELTLVLRQDGTGSRAVTWPGSVNWAGGVAPTLTTTASAVDIVRCFTADGGTTWYGEVVGLDMQ